MELSIYVRLNMLRDSGVSEKFGEVRLPERLIHAPLLNVANVNESVGLLEYRFKGKSWCCRSTSPSHLVIFLDNTHIYNCNGEGHIAKQCTEKKKVKNSKWFKDKMLLAQAQELQATTNFKAGHFDAYNSDCDDKTIPNVIFMENLSSVGSLNDDMVKPHYDSDILSIVPHYDTYHDSDMNIYNIQELGYIENIVSNNESYDELTSKNNVISYTDYMLTIRDDADNYVPPPIQKNDMILSVI
nr:hypothetical protein [Tanacetum cinerariifolium]